MPKITYIEHSGKSHSVDVPKELSVMEGAVQNNIPQLAEGKTTDASVISVAQTLMRQGALRS